MREVVEEAINKRAKIVATGKWEDSTRGVPNPLESLGKYSRSTGATLEEKMLSRTDILDEMICRVKGKDCLDNFKNFLF